jgi:hypothetical protein
VQRYEKNLKEERKKSNFFGLGHLADKLQESATTENV